MAHLVERKVLGTETSPADLRARFARYGLIIIPGSGAEANQTCVVFVHGLRGHVVDTWGRFPRLLLDDPALAGVDLGFFGYQTTLLDVWAPLRRLGSWLPVARPYDFPAKARELADELLSLRGLRRPVGLVLAAHSLGGLIVLEALRQLLASGEPERLETAHSISGLVFYGTAVSRLRPRPAPGCPGVARSARALSRGSVS